MVVCIKYNRSIVEAMLFVLVLLIALFVGFFDPLHLTHPPHGDLLLNANAVFNIHNHIPYVVKGNLQWMNEREYYFYVSPLTDYFSALFWDNKKGLIENAIPPVVWGVIFTYSLAYLFARRYFGRKVAFATIFLMSLSSYWYNYTVRSLYAPWAFLPGFSVLFCWIYLKFRQSGNLWFMVVSGGIAAIAFYFVTWPFIVLVIPSLLIMNFMRRAEPGKSKLMAGFFIFLAVFTVLVAIKEYLFVATGLRYPGDPGGLETYFKIFFQGRWVSEKAVSTFSWVNIFSSMGDNIANVLKMIFIPTAVYPGGNLLSARPLDAALPLMTPLVTLAFIPGLAFMFFKKSSEDINKFLPCIVLLTIGMLAFLLAAPVPRYMLTIFPFVYMIAAYYIVGVYNRCTMNQTKRIIFFLLISALLLFNIKETVQDYMGKVLPAYSRFEHNCYNSIQWPFESLKTFLDENKGDYDLIVIPNNFTSQMITYLRLWPWLVQVDGHPAAKAIASYSLFLKGLPFLRAEQYPNVLIITNVYNSLLNDEICPGWPNLMPYDKTALTPNDVEALFPQAKFLRYAGCTVYSQMLALYEVDRRKL